MNVRQLLSASRRWLMRQEPLYLSLLAMIIGFIAGYLALLLRFSIEWVSTLWTGEIAWDRALHSIPWYVFLLAPTCAGFIVGLINSHLMTGSEMRGVPGVLADLVERRGRINRKQLVTETLGSAIAIGSGAALGREGPTVALGAVIASEMGHFLGLTETQIRTLIGCGVAGAIAASFNTPIAGALFALEVILADYALATFSPIVISSVIATVISRSELGNFPAFMIPQYHLVSTWEIGIYMCIGLACGLVATSLIVLIGKLRALLNRMVPDRRFRPVVAGFILGLLGLVIPYIMSIGYGTVGSILLERIDPVLFGIAFPLGAFLAIVLVGKLFAISLSFAAGFPGGLLGPALFLGSVVGALFGSVVHNFAPIFTESYGAYALVACGALTAAALQAPITIMLMVFELSADYRIMLPLMAACIVATLVKRAFGRASVFTEALEERGIETEWRLEQSWMRSVKVSRIQWRPIPAIPEHTQLIDLKRIYVDSGKGCVQVVDEAGDMVGIITFTDLQPWLLDESMDHVAIAGEVCNRGVQSISENDSLLDAIATFDREIYEQLPVTAADNPRRVLGVLSRHSVFSTYHQLIVKHGEHGGS